MYAALRLARLRPAAAPSRSGPGRSARRPSPPQPSAACRASGSRPSSRAGKAGAAHNIRSRGGLSPPRSSREHQVRSGSRAGSEHPCDLDHRRKPQGVVGSARPDRPALRIRGPDPVGVPVAAVAHRLVRIFRPRQLADDVARADPVEVDPRIRRECRLQIDGLESPWSAPSSGPRGRSQRGLNISAATGPWIHP